LPVSQAHIMSDQALYKPQEHIPVAGHDSSSDKIDCQPKDLINQNKTTEVSNEAHV
jgi:hypothetical protein